MRALRLIALLALVAGFMASCHTNRPFKPVNTQNYARYINGMVANYINPTDPVTITFVRPPKPGITPGSPAPANLFEFKPAIKGAAVWKTPLTLEFIPTNALPMGQRYQGKVDLAKLLAQADSLAPLTFSFNVSRRQVSSFDADYVNKDNGNSIAIAGKIGFTLPATLADVQKSLQLRGPDGLTDLTIKAENNLLYSFTSAALPRNQQSQEYTLNLKADPLQLEEGISRKLELSALHQMVVISASTIESNNKLGIELIFSDPPTTDQDLNALITVSHNNKPMDVDIRPSGNKVHVYGLFKQANSYQLQINQALRNSWGYTIQAPFSKQLEFSYIKPRVEFASDGMFLTSQGQGKIRFKTVNVKKINVQVDMVYASNISQLLQEASLAASRQRNDEFGYYSIERVGKQVYQKGLEIGEQPNKWLEHELDLSQLLEKQEHGLFIVSLKFDQHDITYKASQQDPDDYYNNPLRWGYYYRWGRVFKPVMVSNLGITATKTGKTITTFVADVLQAEPVSNATVTLYSRQNQVLGQAQTNADGQATFTTDEQVMFVQAQKNEQRSVARPGEMNWNLSNFDTGGAVLKTEGLRCYIFSERDIYRPGETAHFGLILRDATGNYPAGQRVNVTVFDPRSQERDKALLPAAQDGLFSYNWTTDNTDPTGTWQLKAEIGDKTFNKEFYVQAVVPERLKISLNPPKQIGPDTQKLVLPVQTDYLFGAPAAGLRAELFTSASANYVPFADYKDYVFANRINQIDLKEPEYAQGQLDDTGKAELETNLPDYTATNTPIVLNCQVTVTEEDGRSAKQSSQVNVYPYNQWVGVFASDKAKQPGMPQKFKAVLVNNKGKAMPGKVLTYNIYKRTRWWWWENSHGNYNYKTDADNQLIATGRLQTASTPVEFSFEPDNWGSYIIEVQDIGGGHISAQYSYVGYWGNNSQADEAGMLQLTADKPFYLPGEEAIISFDTPKNALCYLGLYQGERIVKTWWHKADDSGSTHLSIPVTADFAPNVHLTVSTMQPLQNANPGVPLRSYGLLPIKVENPGSHLDLDVDVAKSLQPQQEFTVKVNTKKPAQVMVMVVDEGLLSLTNYKTPNPFNYFWGKLGFYNQVWDNLAWFIGIAKGDAFKTFVAGGDFALEAYRKKQLSNVPQAQWDNVSFVSAPFSTDSNGKGSISFTMPRYVGAVRVMAVAVNGQAFASSATTVPVKSELMVMPTAPRFVAPNDTFNLPVKVFADESITKPVTITATVSGPLTCPNNSQTITVANGQAKASFAVMATSNIGMGTVPLKAVSGNYTASWEQQVPVRSASPYTSQSVTAELKPGQTTTLTTPTGWLPGTAQGQLTVSGTTRLDITSYINQLVHYPYGCLEQTVSAAIGQVYASDFDGTKTVTQATQNNVNSAIARLKAFWIPQGGFGLWRGSTRLDQYSDAWAGLFMHTAKQKGFYVPNYLLDNWLTHAKQKCREFDPQMLLNNPNNYHMRSQLLRLYTLAAQGKAAVSEMNLLYENYLDNLSTEHRLLLAGSYGLSGLQEPANKIMQSTPVALNASVETQAWSLLGVISAGNNAMAADIYQELTLQLSTKDWLSTRELGVSLMALGSYINANPDLFTRGEINGTVNGTTFTTTAPVYTTPVDADNTSVQVGIAASTAPKTVFATLNVSGIPAAPLPAVNKGGLALNVQLINAKTGQSQSVLPNQALKAQQGEVYQLSVTATRGNKTSLNDMALTLPLPAGFEIETTPGQPGNELELKYIYGINRTGYTAADYSDMRDDRALVFFNMPQSALGITVKLKVRAVTAGNFTMPPVLLECMYDNRFIARTAATNATVSK